MAVQEPTFTNFLALVSLSVVLSTVSEAATLDDGKALHAYLATGYNKYLRPVQDQDHEVNVSVGLSAVAIQEFDEVLEKFSFVGVFHLSWTDESMIWDPSNFSGINDTVFGYENLWTPELILTNPSDKLDSFGQDWQVIRISSNGVAYWNPGDLIKATCAINVYYFPFDIQECAIETYAWAYTVWEVKLVSSYDTIDTSLMAEHGSWSVIETKVKVEVFGVVSKATFVFRLERKPQYIIINVVLPILFLCVLNVLVFLLPPESGERVSYSITVLLSIAVFMTIVSDTLPKTSEPFPLISYLMMVSLIISSIIALITIFNLRVFHKPSNGKVPGWLVRIYLSLKLSSCRDRCSKNRIKTAGLSDNNNASHENSGVKHPPSSKLLTITNENGMNGHIFGTETSERSHEEAVPTWQDISYMFDYVSFIVTFTVTFLSFIIFLINTKTSAK